jgi:Cdc6-like AAA superfamily ATPase
VKGSGKTMILQKALKELKKDLTKSNEKTKQGEQLINYEDEPFKTVYLNGNVHTDDQLALKDISEQLDLANLDDQKHFVRI